jgi:hypothetical protein
MKHQGASMEPTALTAYAPVNIQESADRDIEDLWWNAGHLIG